MAEWKKWWYLYGGVAPEGGDLGGCWAMLIAGEAVENWTEEQCEERKPYEWMTFLGKLDHEPSEEEKEDLTPEEYRNQ